MEDVSGVYGVSLEKRGEWSQSVRGGPRVSGSPRIFLQSVP